MATLITLIEDSDLGPAGRSVWVDDEYAIGPALITLPEGSPLGPEGMQVWADVGRRETPKKASARPRAKKAAKAKKPAKATSES